MLLFPIFRVILEPAVLFPMPILWRVDEVSAPVVLLTLLHAARVRVGIFVLGEVASAAVLDAVFLSARECGARGAGPTLAADVFGHLAGFVGVLRATGIVL